MAEEPDPDVGAAVDPLLADLPEFASRLDERREVYGSLLPGPLVGDLLRWYIEDARHDPPLAGRLWDAVERLLAEGGEGIAAATGEELQAWFRRGTEHERTVLRGAVDLLGDRTRALVAPPAQSLGHAAAHRRQRRRSRSGAGPPRLAVGSRLTLASREDDDLASLHAECDGRRYATIVELSLRVLVIEVCDRGASSPSVATGAWPSPRTGRVRPLPGGRSVACDAVHASRWPPDTSTR